MTTATRPIEHYVEKIKRHVARKFPYLSFDVVPVGHDEVYVYFHGFDPEENWMLIIHRGSGIAMDALVDAGYRIHIQPA